MCEGWGRHFYYLYMSGCLVLNINRTSMGDSPGEKVPFPGYIISFNGTALSQCCHIRSNFQIFFFTLSFRFILHAKKTAFIVEHDFIMATYLADRVVVFEGNPGIDTVACS